MIPHDRIYPKAVEKTREKDAHYGLGSGKESWETMPIESLASAVKYKVDRAIQPSTFATSRSTDSCCPLIQPTSRILWRSLERGKRIM